MIPSRQILSLIVVAQFCCCALWFAGNGVINELLATYSLPSTTLGHLTSAVQFGFICGTLLFAFLSIADRFSPSRVFFLSAVLGAFVNLGMIYPNNTLGSLLLFRFLTGFFLAGIYPVGMKIASDYYREGLGTSLGFLVGALVLGTAFPHLLQAWPSRVLSWKTMVYILSAMSFIGGALILLWVPDGPFRKPQVKKDFTSFFQVFKNSSFRGAALGYFGHMWELYAFWAFVPVILSFVQIKYQISLPIALLSFVIIGVGALSCVAAGYLSRKVGTKRSAATILSLSGACCIISPLIFYYGSVSVVILFLVIWGVVVIADSPLFSTLVAWNVEPHVRGTALTIVNSIGFAITIASIELLNKLHLVIPDYFLFLFLALGPVIGLNALLSRSRSVGVKKT